MPRVAVVKDNPNLVRDLGSNAVLNRDQFQLEEYKAKRAKAMDNRARIERLEDQVDGMNSKLDAILEYLKR